MVLLASRETASGETLTRETASRGTLTREAASRGTLTRERVAREAASRETAGLVRAARETARVLLAELPERWRHTAGVARRAREIGAAVGAAERDLVVAAAWLHDVGYAEPLHDTGFHPLDGARHLRREAWPERLCGLVAHHSGACFVAEARGLGEALAVFGQEVTPVSDALTYADQTVGPGGVRMDLASRLADMLHRHGAGSPNAVAHERRAPYLLAVAGRVEGRLELTRRG